MQNPKTEHLRDELDKGLQKLEALRDEVKLKLHLASLDAKEEWDLKLAPRVLDVELSAKKITESSRSTLHEIIARMEDFLARVRGDRAPSSQQAPSSQDAPVSQPHSTH